MLVFRNSLEGLGYLGCLGCLEWLERAEGPRSSGEILAVKLRR